MSGSYRILCLSHDPALELDVGNWQSGNDGREAAAHAAANPVDHEDLEEHAGCDLMVGRYSYPLLELCCPPGHGHPRDAKWADIQWLRLLWLAQNTNVPEFQRAAAAVSTCWSPQRLNRLAAYLRMES